MLLRLLTLAVLTATDPQREQLLQTCTTNKVLQSCGTGWYRLDATRCMKSKMVLATFDSAETICTDEGGHLVSITSDADYNKVLCLTVQDLTDRNLYWIGARQQQGQYRWIDGNGALTFTNWAPGKPGNPPGGCVEMNYGAWGQWNDQSCSEKRLFVCEKTA